MPALSEGRFGAQPPRAVFLSYAKSCDALTRTGGRHFPAALAKTFSDLTVPFFPMLIRSIFIAFLAAASSALGTQTSADLHVAEIAERRGWLHFDAPLWDLADEGLPFRLTLSLPSRRDLLTRLLFADEARWTLSAGYAKVYNSYDGATGVFKNPGGHAALFSVGRQLRWHLPRVVGAFTPEVVLEFGAHVATRPFPADGTRANFKVISGLEWTWPSRRDTAEWSVGVLWPHFSNGNLFSRNAGYDGLVFRLGRSIRF